MNKLIFLISIISLVINGNNIIIYFTGGIIKNSHPIYIILLLISLVLTFRLPESKLVLFIQTLLGIFSLIIIFIKYFKHEI